MPLFVLDAWHWGLMTLRSNPKTSRLIQLILYYLTLTDIQAVSYIWCNGRYWPLGSFMYMKSKDRFHSRSHARLLLLSFKHMWCSRHSRLLSPRDLFNSSILVKSRHVTNKTLMFGSEIFTNWKSWPRFPGNFPLSVDFANNKCDINT